MLSLNRKPLSSDRSPFVPGDTIFLKHREGVFRVYIILRSADDFIGASAMGHHLSVAGVLSKLWTCWFPASPYETLKYYQNNVDIVFIRHEELM